jgi:hypothetical protein
VTPASSATPAGRPERGFILVTVLVAVLVLTALSMAALSLALAEHRSAEWERRWVGAGPPEGGAALPMVAELGGGYRVVAAVEGGAGAIVDAPAEGEPQAGAPGAFPALAWHQVAWCLDPEREAAGPWGPTLVSAGDDLVPWPDPLPAPRIGPLGVDALLQVAGASSGEAPPLGPGGDVDLAHSDWILEGPVPGSPPPPLRVLVGSGGATLILAGGDLVIRAQGEGPVTLHGAVLTSGTLLLGSGVHLVGGVRGLRAGGPGGEIEPESGLEPEASFAHHRPTVEGALAALPTCPDSLAAFGRLGRHPVP